MTFTCLQCADFTLQSDNTRLSAAGIGVCKHDKYPAKYACGLFERTSATCVGTYASADAEIVAARREWLNKRSGK